LGHQTPVLRERQAHDEQGQAVKTRG
jgi:hypothetical protein